MSWQAVQKLFCLGPTNRRTLPSPGSNLFSAQVGMSHYFRTLFVFFSSCREKCLCRVIHSFSLVSRLGVKLIPLPLRCGGAGGLRMRGRGGTFNAVVPPRDWPHTLTHTHTDNTISSILSTHSLWKRKWIESVWLRSALQADLRAEGRCSSSF